MPATFQDRVASIWPNKSYSAMDLTPQEAARVREDEADRHITECNYDAALGCLDRAIFLQPTNTTLYAKRAQVFWELCDLKSALASYRKLFSIDANPPQCVKDQFAALLNLHGYSLLRMHEPPAVAIAYLSEAIQLNGLEETYWLHRALAHIQANCFDKALKDVDHCICLNARDVEYFVLRAKLHWRLHMHDRATSDIQRAAKLQPDHPEVIEHEQRLLKESQAIYDQACAHAMLREFANVITCLNKAAEISPTETKFYLLRASAYRELGEYHVALKDVERALSLHRHKMELQARKNANQPRDGDVSADLELLISPATLPVVDRSREYREIATQRNLILTDIALRFLRSKSFQLALNAFNQAIRGESELAELFLERYESPKQFVNRGDAYRGLNNFQAALADYHHALEMLPDKSEIKARVAVIHYQFGIELFNRAQFEKAELEFSNAIAQDALVAEYHVRKGDAARYLEKHEAACANYQRALQLSPHDQETKNKLLQYAVKPLSSSSRLPAPHASGNQLLDDSKSSVTSRSGYSSSPRPRTRSESSAAAAATIAADRVKDARKSYEKKNRAVQELFRSRPAMPSVRKSAS